MVTINWYEVDLTDPAFKDSIIKQLIVTRYKKEGEGIKYLWINVNYLNNDLWYSIETDKVISCLNNFEDAVYNFNCL